jgi:hypothetical protein
VLEVVMGRTLDHDYRGCPFLNTATEFPGTHPAKAIFSNRLVSPILIGSLIR